MGGPAQRHRSLVAAALVTLLTLAACDRAPAEPEAAPSPTPAPAIAPLAWEAPGAWAKLDVPGSGDRKAMYRVPKAGNDKEDAEVAVTLYGTGSKGDASRIFDGWLKQFDGDAASSAARAPIAGGRFAIDTIEATGTFKIALTPPAPGKQRSPMAMVKRGWRLVGAVIHTPDRGNWFFELTGPDETVQSASSAFRAMIAGAR